LKLGSNSKRRSKEIYAIAGVLILISLGVPVLAPQGSYKNLPSSGTIFYPKTIELGTWGTPLSAVQYCGDKGTIFVGDKGLSRSWFQGRTVKTYYSGYSDFEYPTWYPQRPITAAAIDAILRTYNSLNQLDWDGFNFLSEETYRVNIAFENGMSRTWFGETLVGWDLYGGTQVAWQEEMFLRMLRGFANWCHSNGKQVGITFPYGIGKWNTIEWYFGAGGWNYIKSNYDYIAVYSYTYNMDFFNNETKPYWAIVDAIPARLHRIAIVTRPWDYSTGKWERECICLEMKNYLDRGFSCVTFGYPDSSYPDFNWQQTWNDMLACVNLWKNNQKYYEYYVTGTNALTGKTGTISYPTQTYGYVS